jgi:hypothetical protein
MSQSQKPEGIFFSNTEAAKLQQIVQLYEIVKSALLFGEEVSPQNVTLPQILKEQRDALDHFIRVLAVKTGAKVQPSNDYVEINLDKAFSHVYRAAYDTLDWISIILRAKINMELGTYSTSAIQASIPEYYSTMRPRIDSVIPEKIAQIRGVKDIGVPEPKSILEYADLVIELKKSFPRNA